MKVKVIDNLNQYNNNNFNSNKYLIINKIKVNIYYF